MAPKKTPHNYTGEKTDTSMDVSRALNNVNDMLDKETNGRIKHTPVHVQPNHMQYILILLWVTAHRRIQRRI